MKNKIKNFMLAVMVMTFTGGSLVIIAEKAEAAPPNDKGATGGGVSAQATAGDVPSIVMTPHGSVEELRPKLSKEFELYLASGVSLHGDNTLKEVGLTLKNRTEASKVIRRRELSDFKSNDFYVSEAIKLLRKYSGMLGVQNLENSIKFNVRKKTRTGGIELTSNIYISGYLLENSLVRVAFGPDDTFIGARFNLPHITSEIYRSVKAAKGKMLSLSKLKDVVALNFAKTGLSNGWIKGVSAKDYKVFVDCSAYPESIIWEKSPYLTWDFSCSFSENRTKDFSGHTWVMRADVVTGELVWGYGGNFSSAPDED